MSLERDEVSAALSDQALIDELTLRLQEAQETLDAIRNGDVDAVMVEHSGSSRIFTLENADRPYRFLIEQMKEGAVTLSTEGLILFGNQRLAELLGTPLEKIVGTGFKRFFTQDQWPGLDQVMACRSSATSRGEFTLAGSDHSLIPISISVTDIELDEGAGRVLGAVITDLTEQRAMEARLSQAQKMEAVGQLTGGLAHDFNNLLQAISGNLSLIKLRPHDQDKISRWAENGLKAAARGAKLTSQLLAFSRSQQVDLRPVDTTALILGMEDLLLRTLGADIEIHYALDDAGVAVMADHTQLELAVLNLAINARDAMPGGGRLQIATIRRRIEDDAELAADDYLELSVSDTGAGMSEAVRSRAFDPFFTTKNVGEGTGLGLAQVYGIARQAGGTAHIESQPGRGTTVTLLLRRSTAVAPVEVEATDVRSAVDIHGDTHVLVIDDDDDVRNFLVESLVMLGYRVTHAADGFAGLTMMENEVPDVLVIDYAMPKINGAEVVKRARERGLNMPVIFASGYSDTTALNDAVGLKATVLLKPFTIEKLASELEAAIHVR